MAGIKGKQLADAPDGITASKINSGAITAAVVTYSDGVTPTYGATDTQGALDAIKVLIVAATVIEGRVYASARGYPMP
jgi:hypothetical protein